jgi:hypothetical protein
LCVDAGAKGIPTLGVILFIVLAAFWAGVGLTRGVEHLSSDQHLNLVLVLKGADPSLFPSDLVFGGEDLANQYIPLYIAYLRSAFLLTGDLAGGYKLLVFPLNLLFLFGAYCVFLRCCRDRWGAVILAVFASFPIAIPLAGELFGIGPVQAMTARMLFTAPFPFLFLAFSAWIQRPVRLALLFFVIGLLANLHPVSGLFGAAILILTYLMERKGAWQSWGTSVLLGVATLCGAAPILWTQLHRLAAQAAGSASIADPRVVALMADRMRYLLYPPHTMASIPRLLVDLLTLFVALVSIIAMTRVWHKGAAAAWLVGRCTAAGALFYLLYPDAKLLCLLLLLGYLLPQRYKRAEPMEELATHFSLSVFWVSIGGVVFVQLLFGVLGRPVLFADTIRAARFAGFAVFLLLGVSVSAVDWASVSKRGRIACLALVVVTGFWELRDTYRTYLRTRGDAVAADLAAVARWARDTTEREDVFLFDSPGFRVLARRSVAFATKDGLAVVYHRPDRAAEWVGRQEILRLAGGNPHALWEAGIRYGVDFIVIPAAAVKGDPLETRVRYRNATYAVLATDRTRSHTAMRRRAAGEA